MFSGNPLAVLTDARGSNDQAMQSIAREFNFSETTFVTPPVDKRNTARVRIFTPAANCRLPGIRRSALRSFWRRPAPTENGNRAGARRKRRPGARAHRARQRQSRALHFHVGTLAGTFEATPPSRRAVADMLQLTVDEVVAPAEVWSCGVPYLVMPVASSDALMRAQLDLTQWREALTGSVTHEIYPIAQIDESDLASANVRAGRRRGRRSGNWFSGGGACGLAGALWPASIGHAALDVLQGEAVSRPSRIELEADVADGVVQAVRVGGASVLVSEGVLRL